MKVNTPNISINHRACSAGHKTASGFVPVISGVMCKKVNNMNDTNLYRPPKSHVENSASTLIKEAPFYFKYIITYPFSCIFLTCFSFIFNKGITFENAAIWGCVCSVLSGVFAIFTPTSKKIIYIPAGVLLNFIIIFSLATAIHYYGYYT